MNGEGPGKLVKWPFLLGDILLVLMAFRIAYAGPPPSPGMMLLAVGCLSLGAMACMLPYLVEYRVAARIAEASSLDSAVSKLKDIESVAAQISTATSNWQEVQEESSKTAGAAKTIADQMAREARAFAEVMQKANDKEKTHLRLELEKLHRAETDWLQVLVYVMDHIHALHKGALRSGQPSLIEQIAGFQNACRDAARRVGLTPFLAPSGEKFDSARHQLVPGSPEPAVDAQIEDTIATGYTFQGRLLRPVLVSLKPGAPQAATAVQPTAQSDLGL